VTAVDVSNDLRHARIYISCLDHHGRQAVHAVARSLGRLRHHLSRSLRLRTVPRLALEYDETAERVARLDALFKAERGPCNSEPGDPATSSS
jgi:ribosome-binding factor A